MENQLKEINLLDIINTVRKEKKIIFSLFFLGLILGVAWFFLAPLKYEGTTFIEIGSIKRMHGLYATEEQYIEDPVNLVGKIRNGIYGVEVSEAVNIRNTLLIEIKILDKDYDKVKEDFNNLNKAIVESHKIKMQKEKEEIGKLLSILEKEIQSIEKDISFLTLRGQQVGSLYLEIDRVQAELERIESTALIFIPTEVIKEPDVVEKKPSVFIPLFSAILGLFLGFSLAFIKSSRH
ncbi:hypothetical protein AMJ47_00250 [Parcubacteria bacterium DG_72]|nr:MAG: hypothetical protein AMJ47_00250 [Parcubacteria bacterium DG_72]